MQGFADQPVPFVSTRPVAFWASLLLGVCGVFSLLSIATDIVQIVLVWTNPDSGQVSFGELDPANRPGGWLQLAILLVRGGVSIFYFLSVVITAILFLVWLKRAYRNLSALDVASPQYTPGWVIGSWFVPFLNMVRPFQIVKELWVESDPNNLPSDDTDSGPFGGTLAQVRNDTPMLLTWWIFWIGGNAVHQWAGQLGDGLRTFGDLAFLSWVDMFGFALTAVSAALAIKVVRGVVARQDERYQRLRARTPGFTSFDRREI